MRLLVCLVVLALLATPSPSLAKRETIELPLQVRVARCDGKPVKPDSWVAAHVKAANRILEPHAGVVLTATVERFEPDRCELLTRAHRDALASHASPGAVTVLVVRRARDVDLPSYNLMGVHWRYGGKEAAHQGRRWIILTARARPPVLAHELCHYLGLRHDPAGGNLMAPGPSDPSWRHPETRPAPWKPTLTRSQARRVRAAVRRLRRAAATP